MAQVEVRIFHPISYQMTGEHRGLVLKKEIEPGMSLESFLVLMQETDSPVWKTIWNREARISGEDIIIIFQGKVLNNKTICSTSLNEGDTIMIRKMFHGG